MDAPLEGARQDQRPVVAKPLHMEAVARLDAVTRRRQLTAVKLYTSQRSEYQTFVLPSRSRRVMKSIRIPSERASGISTATFILSVMRIVRCAQRLELGKI